jgi:hypothetical protein
LAQTFKGEGVNFVTADASPDNAITNGTNLRAAYAAAKLLTPNGAALSATNRAVVFVPPGKYDLVTTPLTMDTEFVDLVGLSGQPEHVLITSAVAVDNNGTLVQTANDVLISGVTLENTQNTNSPNYDATDPAAYMSASGGLNFAKLRDVVMRGVNLGRSMRVGIIYSGTFTNCTGGYGAFGGGYGTASGTFKDCTGGDQSFGYGNTASGTFTGCTGGGGAFGGGGGTASGTFTNCTGGGGAFGGGGGTASGTFTNCTGGGGAFGGGRVASGTFTNCTGGSGAWNASITGATCRLFFCRLTSGSFGTRTNGAKIKQSFAGDTLVNDA